MKNSYILLLLLALSPTLFTLGQQYGWRDISANIPGDSMYRDLSDVFFVSDNEGWITSSSYAEIYHTTDGGETFEIQTTPLGATMAIHMLDENHGYSGGVGGWIYVTSNGGDDWNILGSMGVSVLDISFPPGTNPDDPVGYACGGGGNVWEITTTLANLNSGSSTVFSGISAPSVDNVWVTGGNRIYHYDGSEFTSQSGPAGTFNDIHFINDNEGWVVGNGGVIGQTSNAGETWNTQIGSGSGIESLYGVFFLDGINGWAAGFMGVIVQTSDGGENWAIVDEGHTDAFLNGVHFTSPTNGYVVGNDKTLLKYAEVSGMGEREHGIAEVWPNPTRGKLQISNSKFQTKLKTQNSKFKIEVVDLFGHVVDKWNREPGTANCELDISHCPAGIYFIRIYLEDQMIVKKIIKL